MSEHYGIANGLRRLADQIDEGKVEVLEHSWVTDTVERPAESTDTFREFDPGATTLTVEFFRREHERENGGK